MKTAYWVIGIVILLIIGGAYVLTTRGGGDTGQEASMHEDSMMDASSTGAMHEDTGAMMDDQMHQ